tara:strand:- start:304 stop:759 length:456 start_codon:yes stop_codon:yes gene_type:complete
MEFILFLSKIDKEIIELINKSNHSIEENTALCLIDKKFVGFFKKREKGIVICTKNAKKLGGYREDKRYDNHKTNIYIRRALRHEATHLVQSCNNNKPIGIIKNIQDRIHEGKLKALNSSVQLTGNYEKELEAYVLEDKPRKVKEILKSYCL